MLTELLTFCFEAAPPSSPLRRPGPINHDIHQRFIDSAIRAGPQQQDADSNDEYTHDPTYTLITGGSLSVSQHPSLHTDQHSAHFIDSRPFKSPVLLNSRVQLRTVTLLLQTAASVSVQMTERCLFLLGRICMLCRAAGSINAAGLRFTPSPLSLILCVSGSIS